MPLGFCEWCNERPFAVARTARRGQADILDRHGSRIAGAALARRIDEIRRDRRRSLVVPTVETPPATAVPERAKTVEQPAVTTIDAQVVRLRHLGVSATQCGRTPVALLAPGGPACALPVDAAVLVSATTVPGCADPDLRVQHQDARGRGGHADRGGRCHPERQRCPDQGIRPDRC